MVRRSAQKQRRASGIKQQQRQQQRQEQARRRRAPRSDQDRTILRQQQQPQQQGYDKSPPFDQPEQPEPQPKRRSPTDSPAVKARAEVTRPQPQFIAPQLRRCTWLKRFRLGQAAVRAVVAEERAEAGAVSSSMLAASSRLEAGLSATARQPQEPDRTVIGTVTAHSACAPSPACFATE